MDREILHSYYIKINFSVTFINKIIIPVRMVRRALRSRSLRKIKVRTPGSRVAIHYRPRKPKIAHCSKCGAILKGVPRERPTKMANLAKTKKRPERPFAGTLCSNCVKILFKAKAKSL